MESVIDGVARAIGLFVIYCVGMVGGAWLLIRAIMLLVSTGQWLRRKFRRVG